MRSNGWNEYKKLILHELKENNESLKDILSSITNMKEDITSLKVKATVAGGIAGMVGTGIVTAIFTVFK